MMTITKGFSNIKLDQYENVIGDCDVCGTRTFVVSHVCPGAEQTVTINPIPDHITLRFTKGWVVIDPHSMAALFALDNAFPNGLWMDNTLAIPVAQLGTAIAAVSSQVQEDKAS